MKSLVRPAADVQMRLRLSMELANNPLLKKVSVQRPSMIVIYSVAERSNYLASLTRWWITAVGCQIRELSDEGLLHDVEISFK